MKCILKFFITVVLGILISVGFAGADSKPPAEGGVLPKINLNVPENSKLQQYLGVNGKESFTIPEINAEVVIIEIFSMY